MPLCTLSGKIVTATMVRHKNSMMYLNSLAPERCGSNFASIFFKLGHNELPANTGTGTQARELLLMARFMGPTWGPTWDQQDPGWSHAGPMVWWEQMASTIWLQVMAWCLAAPRHYLKHCLAAPRHYLKQCWLIVNRTFRNTLQWSFNQKIKVQFGGPKLFLRKRGHHFKKNFTYLVS